MKAKEWIINPIATQKEREKYGKYGLRGSGGIEINMGLGTMINKNKSLVLETVKHWERIREWVKTQPPEADVNIYAMSRAINEVWEEVDCPLCQEYFLCINCPLCLKNVSCNHYTSPWKKVNNAKTWGEWLEASDGMIKSLKEIIEAD